TILHGLADHHVQVDHIFGYLREVRDLVTRHPEASNEVREGPGVGEGGVWGISEHAGAGVASVMVDKMELDDPIDTISSSLFQPSSSSPLQPIFSDPDSNTLRDTKETRLPFPPFCFGVCGPAFFLEPTRMVLFACFSRLSRFFRSASSCSL
ncbi:hypothetical protein L211DRAFT_878992, partial [Terfezia boudieri ATCC MYA-4762]